MPLFATFRKIFHCWTFEIRKNSSCLPPSELLFAHDTPPPTRGDKEVESHGSHHATTHNRYVIFSHLLLLNQASQAAFDTPVEHGLRKAPRGIHLALSVHFEQCPQEFTYGLPGV